MQSLKRLLYAVFYPTIWLADRLGMLSKFLIFLFLNLLVLSYLGFSYLDGLTDKLDKNRQKVEAIKLNNTLFSLMFSLQTSRGMMRAQRKGEKRFEQKLFELEKQNVKYLDRLKKLLDQSWSNPKISLQYEDLNTYIRKEPITAYSTPEQSAKVLSLISGLIDSIAHFSAVLLAEDKQSYFKARLLYTILPSLIETHSKLRGLGTEILTTKSISTDEKQQLLLYKYHFLLQLQRMQEFITYHQLFSDEKMDEFHPVYAVPESIKMLENTLLKETFSISNELYFNTFTKVNDRYAVYCNRLDSELLGHLNELIKKQERECLLSYSSIIILIFALFYILIGALLSAHFFTQKFLKTTQDVANGKLDKRLHVPTQNEYGKISRALNNMIENLEQSAKIIDQYVDTSKTDLEGRITSVSTAFARNNGYTKEELIGKKHSIQRHPETPDEIYTQMWSQLTQEKIWEGEIKNRRKDGSDFWVEMLIVPTYDKEHRHNGYMSIRRDISNQKHIEKLAITDYLTQIYNRQFFNEELNKSISMYHRYQTPFALIMLDIDYFKQINDTYGHLVGDECLIELSSLIKTHLRENDILARWGGEEFMILLPYSSQDEAMQIAQKLRSLVEFHLFNNIGSLTISLGVSCFSNEDSFDTILERTDKALYRAKVEGRNRVVFL